MMLTKITFVLCLVSVLSGLLSDGPCDIRPDSLYRGIPARDYRMTWDVPAWCTNGTFEWHYPSGYMTVTFTNSEDKMMTSICMRDTLGADTFRIIDMTGGHDSVIALDWRTEGWNCTTPTRAREIVLQVDGPYSNVYMGEFEYKIKQVK